MRLPYFISGSAVILAGWLGLTFVYEVPSQRYPKFDKYPTTALREKNAPAAAIIGNVFEVFQISRSR